MLVVVSRRSNIVGTKAWLGGSIDWYWIKKQWWSWIAKIPCIDLCWDISKYANKLHVLAALHGCRMHLARCWTFLWIKSVFEMVYYCGWDDLEWLLCGPQPAKEIYWNDAYQGWATCELPGVGVEYDFLRFCVGRRWITFNLILTLRLMYESKT